MKKKIASLSILRVMLNKQKQQQIVYLINCGTPEQDYNFLKHSGEALMSGKFFEALTSTKSFNTRRGGRENKRTL